MDNGEVIPGLNDGYTFLGAKIMEWMSGFIMAMLTAAIFQINITQWAPLLVIIAFFTTTSMAKLRRSFPDEERGIANLCASRLGFSPPGIPRPARIQPFWSGCPIKGYPELKEFNYLGLDEVFSIDEVDDTNYH